MSNDNDKVIDGMSLTDEVKHPKPLDMDLEGPDVVHVGTRIATLFPDADVIDLIDDLKIMRMADGSYQVKGKSLKELASLDLKKLDEFLKSKEAEK